MLPLAVHQNKRASRAHRGPRPIGVAACVLRVSRQAMLSATATVHEAFRERRARAVTNLHTGFDAIEARIAASLCDVHEAFGLGDVHLSLAQQFANHMVFKVGTVIDGSLMMIPCSFISPKEGAPIGVRVTYGSKRCTYGPPHGTLPACFKPIYSAPDNNYQTWVKVGCLEDAVKWIGEYKDTYPFGKPVLTVAKIGAPGPAYNSVSGVVCITGVVADEENVFGTPGRLQKRPR